MNLAIKRRLLAWGLFLPQLALSFLLIIGIGIGMVQSLGIIPSLGLKEWTFAYYQELFSKPQFTASLYYSIKIAFVSASLATVLGLGLAYLWLQEGQLPSWLRFVIKIPIVIPHLVVALFSLQLLSRTGLLARLLFALGFDQAQTYFNSFLFQSNGLGVILAYLWKEIPFVLFYCYPILETISSKLGEAAWTLGANKWQTYYKIVLPLAKKTIFASFFIIFMFSFGSYELPALLGPTLPKALPIAAYDAYTHPDLLERPRAMALNGTILLVGLGLTLVIYTLLVGWPSLKRRSRNER